MMMKTVLAFALVASAALAQYKMEPVSTPPAGLSSEFASVLQTQGIKVANAAGTAVCEVWFRKSAPTGPKVTEDAVSYPTIPHGALLGVIAFPAASQDRRGQTIKPGVYTLRYSRYPVDGNHQGVAPVRDFLMLVPASIDKDPNATPEFDPLMDMSRKASGTPHPACLEMAPPAADATFPGLVKAGEKDWAVDVKVGDVPVGVIVVGKSES